MTSWLVAAIPSSQSVPSVVSHTASTSGPHIRSRHRCLQQASAIAVVDPRQEFIGEVFDDETVIALERCNEGVTVVAGSEGQAGEHESGGPAFGAFAQRFNLSGRRRRTTLGDEHCCFVGSEPQIVGSHFGQLTSDSEPRQSH